MCYKKDIHCDKVRDAVIRGGTLYKTALVCLNRC